MQAKLKSHYSWVVPNSILDALLQSVTSKG